MTRALAAAALMFFVMERPVFRPAGSEDAQTPQTTGFPTTAGRITGRVVLNGHPAAAARVQARAVYLVNGERRLVAPNGSAYTSNNDGTYEFVMPPGLYVIYAQPEGWDLARRVNRPVASQPTLHPSATDLAQAHLVRVEAGRTAEGIDIDCVLNAPASISGRVVTPDGKPAMMPSVGVTSLTSFGLTRTSTIPPDDRGSFLITGLPPGRYELNAAANRDQTGEWTRAEVVVDGRDVTDLVLTLSKPLTLTGRIVFRAHQGTAVPDLSTLTAAIFGAAPTVTGVGLVTLARVSADGSFAASGLQPGRYAVQVRFPPPPQQIWTVESTEVTDVREASRCCWLFGVVANVPVRGTPEPITVVLTDRAASLSGIVTGAGGRPSASHVVVVVPADRAAWVENSTRMPHPVRPAADGRYEFASVPPGDYVVAALADVDHTAWSFGVWPEIDTTKATRITIASGEQKTLNLGMEGPVFRPAQTKLEQTSRDAPPPGSLSGRVALDRPRQGLMDVRAFRVWTVQGERRLGGRDGGYEARFDYNTGEYEIPGLPPGDYVVVAMTQEVSSTTWSAADKARAAKMARTGVPLVPRTSPTFYPAAVEAEAAEIVTIAAGSDVRGIDVTPMGRQWALITGRVVDALNRPSPYAQVAIGLASLPAALEPMLRLQNSLSKPDGSFALTVPAGRYVLTSRGSGIAVAQPGATQRGLFAQTEITVSSVDIEDLVLRLEEGATIAGTLTVDSSSASRPNLGFWVGAFAEDVAAAVPAFMALVRPDGTFRIDGISPGRYSLRTTSQGWLTERVIVDGRSVVDAPLDLHQGQSISGVEIAITDRQTTLTCSVQDSAGAPITTYTLAIVPADPALRRTGSARMPKPDRPSVKDGRYTVTGLPPGDYLIFALSDHDEDAWAAGIRPSLDPASAVKVSLGIGDKKDVAVRLAGKAPGPGPKPEAHATR